MSLFDCLPDDVLGEVFMTARDMLTPVKNSYPAWQFSRVCSRWRAVALSYPALWAKIDVLLKARCDAIVSLYLERSQGMPLRVSIRSAPGTKVKEEFDAREQLLSVLERSMTRWCEFDISEPPAAFNSTYAYRVFDHQWDKQFPRLERLVVPTFNILSRSGSLGQATMLKDLHISDMNIPPEGRITLPVEQIESLTINTRDQLTVGLQRHLLGVGDTIATFPNVKKVTIYTIQTAEVVPYQATFSSITCLVFAFGIQVQTQFWGSLDHHMADLYFPSLEDIQIVGKGNMLRPYPSYGANNIYQLFRFIKTDWLFDLIRRHRGERLTKLTIDNILLELPWRGFQALLWELPTLTHLVVREPVECNAYITDNLIYLLKENSGFLSDLKELELIWKVKTNPGNVDEIGIVRMLEARSFRGATVGSFLPHNLTPRAKELYIALRRKGLRECQYY
ncbi:hypothetical protein CYLTODRAFT_493155 [Cylindrobasidium torrendii FP15055 ss-10]|uniref:Uncharacterized protein n=1 Tax=Cylindrobasidium torrendii FP15055 ss-10 TaxID=1314674 RepID=A0A0D7B2H6_9AGAR|nr:hypothetical protein CYLTODRAFT_493155 [Cylindrobasidium torrendii FP15055 ss-10]